MDSDGEPVYRYEKELRQKQAVRTSNLGEISDAASQWSDLSAE